MEGQKEVYARRCFTAPVCVYRLRSRCNRWLSFGRPEQVALFVADEPDASVFVLVPSDDGRYMLQLLSVSQSKTWFLCCRGNAVGCTPNDSDGVFFSLELDESGRVSFRGGLEGGYLTTDRDGCIWVGTGSRSKWDKFNLVEKLIKGIPECAPWLVRAPLRVTMQASSGKYLCAAKPVVTSYAEAPCCCEEFLIDLPFSVIQHEQTHGELKPKRSFLQALFCYKTEETESSPVQDCTIRTADGDCLISAETDGDIYAMPVESAQGRETFAIKLQPNNTITIQRAGSYLSVEHGRLVNRKPHRRSGEQFNIQLANGSRVLVRSIHGGFLSASKDKDGIQGWQLRSHGDSVYTLTSASTLKRGADIYMFVDASGHIYQSSDPAVHFPAPSSMFEIKPVSAAGIPRTSSSSSIIGFTIRTRRKIKGKQRYLSVEPNGAVRAVKLKPSRWELFQLIDIDATAAVVDPVNFSCVPASLNRQPSSTYGPVFPRVLPSPRKVTSPGISARACEVAVLAVSEGQAVPKKSPSSLQEICITQVCSDASAGVYESDTLRKKPSSCHFSNGEDEYTELVSALCSLARRHELLPVDIPSDLTGENGFNIPDDLLTRIWSTSRMRQLPKNSCKWLPSAFLPQGAYARNRFQGRTNRVMSTEGWHCSTCDHGNVLPMDASVNPAHHRYLEVQSRVYSRAIQSTGILWNIISLAGVSIMSTALFCQLKAATGRRSIAHRSFIGSM